MRSPACIRLIGYWLLPLFIVACPYAQAQEPKDKEVRPVPADIQARIRTYYALLVKEDWEKLYEIDDWPIRNKEDYINIQIADKTNPHIRVQKVYEVGLLDTMFYFASSKKWQIDGCARFKLKDGEEKTAFGNVWLVNDADRGWLVRSAAPAYFADGWRECKMPLSQFPFKLNLSK